MDALGHVDERATRPHARVERGELVVTNRDDGAEVLLEEVLVLLQRRVGVEEEHALGLEVLTDRVVDDLRLVLSRDAGDEALLLRLGDAELVVGVLDVLGKVLPRGGLLLRGAHEVLDVVEVDRAEVGAPRGIGLRPKSFRPFRRRSSIHCGSLFFPEMSRTMASLRPRWAEAPATSGSAQPNS